MAHYAFAMEYLGAALNLPIMMNLFSADLQQKLKKSNDFKLAINLCYYGTLLSLFCVLQDWKVFKDDPDLQ